MEIVKAKKHLGQHFLKDQNIASNIVRALTEVFPEGQVLEVGPGMGVLTGILLETSLETWASEIDPESVAYLHIHFPQLGNRLLSESFTNMRINQHFPDQVAVIGNFPYNISSQIVFHIIDNQKQIPFMVGMFQKEVAERICEGPGSKAYGILSVITQFYYNVEYLFTVSEHVFSPPPKVKSAVIRFSRKQELAKCDEQLFRKVVKMAFNQRRKMLRNGLSAYGLSEIELEPFGTKRAEELSLEDFVVLTNRIDQSKNAHQTN